MSCLAYKHNDFENNWKYINGDDFEKKNSIARDKRKIPHTGDTESLKVCG